MSLARDIIASALDAVTLGDAREVQDLIAAAIGERNQRPLADRWVNHGLMSPSGSYDLKLVELVTNMQDAVVERFVLERYNDRVAVPYRSPTEAKAAVLDPLLDDERTRLATVAFRDSDPPRGRNKRLTAIFRDYGCGLTARSVPATIFHLAGSHKEDALYLQGAFGLGGAMTYKNARAVVLVTRRQPALLGSDEEDNITVAVVQWATLTKGQVAYYLVDRPWSEPGDKAFPWSTPAREFPDFEPGTHLALVSYSTEGIHISRLGDPRSFDTILNTRLLQPILPTRFDGGLRQRSEVLRGLYKRLADNPGDRPHGTEVLPFTHGGVTYQLPVSFYLFAKGDEPGSRRRFVARDHALLFTSNGQVHHHWTPQQFRNRTQHKKLDSRILVVVETDELPIGLRTSLFTPDRSTLVRNAHALRLEETVEAFLNDWEVLRDANSALIRESLRAQSGGPTANIARRIARALTVRGFNVGGSGSSGGPGGAGGSGGRSGTRRKPIPIHDDPTRLEGPATARAEIGKTRFLTYILDAPDDFLGGRGELQVECDDPVIGPRDITVGTVHKGRVRVSVAVPEDADPAVHTLTVTLDGWLRKAGGLGATLRTETKLELVPLIEPSGAGKGKPTGGGEGDKAAAAGNNVAVLWDDHDNTDREGWTASTVGAVEQIPAHMLADTDPANYADLAALGDTNIPTVVLNAGYTPWKDYLHRRTKTLTETEGVKERYATGVGVHLLLLDQELAKRRADNPPDPDLVATSMRAAARAVLSVLPAFDELAREAGLEEEV